MLRSELERLLAMTLQLGGTAGRVVPDDAAVGAAGHGQHRRRRPHGRRPHLPPRSQGDRDAAEDAGRGLCSITFQLNLRVFFGG